MTRCFISWVGAFLATQMVQQATISVKFRLGVTLSVEKLFKNASPLQKNQMYNWFDRYKPQEQQKVYILSSEMEQRPILNLPMIKRRRVKKA